MDTPLLPIALQAMELSKSTPMVLIHNVLPPTLLHPPVVQLPPEQLETNRVEFGNTSEPAHQIRTIY